MTQFGCGHSDNEQQSAVSQVLSSYIYIYVRNCHDEKFSLSFRANIIKINLSAQHKDRWIVIGKAGDRSCDCTCYTVHTSTREHLSDVRVVFNPLYFCMQSMWIYIPIIMQIEGEKLCIIEPTFTLKHIVISYNGSQNLIRTLRGLDNTKVKNSAYFLNVQCTIPWRDTKNYKKVCLLRGLNYWQAESPNRLFLRYTVKKHISLWIKKLMQEIQSRLYIHLNVTHKRTALQCAYSRGWEDLG
jgi:hypothetical protein